MQNIKDNSVADENYKIWETSPSKSVSTFLKYDSSWNKHILLDNR